MTPHEARILIEYNHWANERVVQAVRELTPAEFIHDLGGSFGSVRSTLVHMLWAEWLWLERWEGRSPKERFDPQQFKTEREIDSRWADVYTRQKRFVAGLTADSLTGRVSYENLQGKTWEYSRAHMIQHVANHSTYHRGQVVAELRQLNRKPPATDFLVYLDEGAPEG
ncbi:MAG TPA: DinB family protein [Vicinamibacterales bacterium]